MLFGNSLSHDLLRIYQIGVPSCEIGGGGVLHVAQITGARSVSVYFNHR